MGYIQCKLQNKKQYRKDHDSGNTASQARRKYDGGRVVFTGCDFGKTNHDEDYEQYTKGEDKIAHEIKIEIVKIVVLNQEIITMGEKGDQVTQQAERYQPEKG
jgi:hypothetical protein